MLESFCSAMKWDIKNWLCTITKIQRIEHKRPIKIVNTDMLLAIWFSWYNPQYSTSILYTKYREYNKIDWVVLLDIHILDSILEWHWNNLIIVIELHGRILESNWLHCSIYIKNIRRLDWCSDGALGVQRSICNNFGVVILT